LQEISWSGSSVRAYRDGGRGHENVLTAEALMALDFLPRRHFLGEVLLAARGADRARQLLAAESEEATVTLLPDQLLIPSVESAGHDGIVVQPDAEITSPGCYALVEAKRIRRSQFAPEQLAREYLAALQYADRKSPLLLLVLGSQPPVPVAGMGRLSIVDAVDAGLPTVLDRVAGHTRERSDLLDRHGELVAWITWWDLADAVVRQQASFGASDPSIDACVSRLVESALTAVKRHS